MLSRLFADYGHENILTYLWSEKGKLLVFESTFCFENAVIMQLFGETVPKSNSI